MSRVCETNAGIPTDEQAMWQVQNLDDPGAFAWLVRRWEAPIQHLCGQVVGDAHLAKDLSQEAFTRVFLKRKQYRPGAKFSTWVWRIALNLCYSRLRKAQCRLDRQLGRDSHSFCAEPESISEDASPDRCLLAREQAVLLQNALDRLPEPLRAILLLRYCEGMKLREVAKQLQIPETTAASRCEVALARLTRILERDFGFSLP